MSFCNAHSWSRWLLVGAIVACGPAWGQDLDVHDDAPPPVKPNAATGWGCRLATLISNEDCVLEGVAGRKAKPEQQAKLNLAAVGALADKACAEAAKAIPAEKPNSDLVSLCKDDFREAAGTHCDFEGRVVVLDSQGRFTPESKHCYFSLGEVLRNTARIARTGVACCRCTFANNCSPNIHDCLRYLAEDPPVVPDCAGSDCYPSCLHFLQARQPAAKSAPKSAEPPPPGSTAWERDRERDRERTRDREREEERYRGVERAPPLPPHPPTPYAPD